MAKSYKEYVYELIELAWPIIMGQIGFTFILAGDVFVAGKYSTDVLSAVSISGAVTSIIFMFGIGLIISVSPVLSNRLGAKKSAKKFFYPTILFSQIIAFFSMLLILATIPLMEHMGFNPKLMPDIKIYTFIFAFSAFGGYLHAALKEFLQAYEIVFFPNFIAIIGIFLNLFFNWIFAFGWGIIPSMGAMGLGIASTLIRTIMGLSLFIFARNRQALRPTCASPTSPDSCLSDACGAMSRRGRLSDRGVRFAVCAPVWSCTVASEPTVWRCASRSRWSCL